MKWLLGIVVLLAALGFVYPEAVPTPIRHWLSATPELPTLPAVNLPTLAGEKPATTLYKWQDTQGRWQVSDQPPKDRPYETLHYRHDANVVPSANTTPKVPTVTTPSSASELPKPRDWLGEPLSRDQH